jgi:hypothetical protein
MTTVAPCSNNPSQMADLPVRPGFAATRGRTARDSSWRGAATATAWPYGAAAKPTMRNLPWGSADSLSELREPCMKLCPIASPTSAASERRSRRNSSLGGGCAPPDLCS